MNVLDLFSGIGGFSLGLERAGMRTVAFCEIEPYCRAVLRKHWPHVPIYEDVRELTAARLAADGIKPEVICGGFPCQDISNAGKRDGIEGERSRLWSEFARLIGEIRPKYAIVENVAALLGRGLSRVLGDLSEIGYDAEWQVISAADVGAPHLRERVWILAYPRHAGIRERGQHCDACQESGHLCGVCGDELSGGREEETEVLADTESKCVARESAGNQISRMGLAGSSQERSVADAEFARQPRQRLFIDAGNRSESREGQAVNAVYGGFGDQWAVEPDVGRVANGVPSRVDRLKGIGNAVVPQIPEIIGRAIMQAEGIA